MIIKFVWDTLLVSSHISKARTLNINKCAPVVVAKKPVLSLNADVRAAQERAGRFLYGWDGLSSSNCVPQAFHHHYHPHSHTTTETQAHVLKCWLLGKMRGIWAPSMTTAWCTHMPLDGARVNLVELMELEFMARKLNLCASLNRADGPPGNRILMRHWTLRNGCDFQHWHWQLQRDFVGSRTHVPYLPI